MSPCWRAWIAADTMVAVTPQHHTGMLDIEAIRAQARGAWAMVAADGRTVVASGDDVEAVVEEAERLGAGDAVLLAMDFWNEIFIG